ncbi:MAG: thiamine pyrophosphate-binding protein [Polyangiaceae bacterium]|nr:thiamine pyrophosphate-binding protein [Polyangiaceae bacterium]
MVAPHPASQGSGQALDLTHSQALPRTSPKTISTALVHALEDLGIQMSFGVIGGAISPFCHALNESSIQYLHFRHETGAAFSALEASLATGRPTLVFTTAGPGLTNALTGMSAARWDGGHVLLVSACTSLPHRGRAATQETGPHTLPSIGMFLSGPPFHHASILDHPAGLEPLVAELSRGFSRRDGYVAHVSLPIAIQTEKVSKTVCVPFKQRHPRVCAREVAEHYAQMLQGKKLAIWLGFGARKASKPILEFAELTSAKVIASPRGKGTFPEDHPLYVGVTGLGGDSDVDSRFAEDPPDYTLVLGTRMGESTSFWAGELTPKEAFIHIDVNPAAFGAAFPGAATHAVESDVEVFLDALLQAWTASPVCSHRRHRPPRAQVPPRQTGPVRPQVLFDTVQSEVVDKSDSIVLAESGNSFCWATHLLRFQTPGRYRVSTGFGSMGHATTGVVGAALATGKKAYAVVGDGAMLMLSEISSAVQYGAKAVWVVLNDACYLMCEQGMRVLGWEPFGTSIPRVDFATLAKAQGADGEIVRSELDLSAAFARAHRSEKPYVLDIQIDPREIAPSGKRHKNLMQQGFGE